METDNLINRNTHRHRAASFSKVTWSLGWEKEEIKLTQVNLIFKNLEESAQLLNRDSLSCRMEMGGRILAYKILHGSLEGFQWK